MGVEGARPDPHEVPEGFLWFSTDTRSVWASWSGSWVEVADLTASVDWGDLTNKPATFPPDEHDLDDHTGALSITRVLGHDLHDPAHLRSSLMPMVLGRF